MANPTDELDIMRLRTFYGRYADELVSRGAEAADDLAMLFSENCVVDFTELLGRTLKGRTEIKDCFLNTIAPVTGWTWHAITTPTITIDGDTATGGWLVYALSTGKDHSKGAPVVTYGRYIDRYVRTAVGWKIEYSKFLDETRPGDPAARSQST
jgi:hypothetical protein